VFQGAIIFKMELFMKWHDTELSDVYFTLLSFCADQTLHCLMEYFFSPIHCFSESLPVESAVGICRI